LPWTRRQPQRNVQIATDLHFGSASLSWVLNAYSLAFGGRLLLGGRLGDVLGRRRVFMTGLGLFDGWRHEGGRPARWSSTASGQTHALFATDHE
jgi:MFS family permease